MLAVKTLPFCIFNMTTSLVDGRCISFILGRSPADTNSLNYSPTPENYLRQQPPALRTISQWLSNLFGKFSPQLIIDIY